MAGSEGRPSKAAPLLSWDAFGVHCNCKTGMSRHDGMGEGQCTLVDLFFTLINCHIYCRGGIEVRTTFNSYRSIHKRLPPSRARSSRCNPFRSSRSTPPQPPCIASGRNSQVRRYTKTHASSQPLSRHTNNTRDQLSQRYGDGTAAAHPPRTTRRAMVTRRRVSPHRSRRPKVRCTNATHAPPRRPASASLTSLKPRTTLHTHQTQPPSPSAWPSPRGRPSTTMHGFPG